MLPMGSIMTACMATGVLFGARAPGKNRAGRRVVLVLVGVVLLLAGLWNAGWHAPRNIGNFWGQAALASGLLMLLVSAYLLVPKRLPLWLRQARPFVVIALAGFALLYGVTIYRL